jgi:23S rRNA-/tRNA-specific pseudouridylate synthase
MSNESWTVDAPGRLAAEVKRRLDLSHRRAQALIDRGAVEVDGARVTDHGHPLCAGAQVRVSIDAPRRPAQESTPPGEILHEDSHIIVVHKRAGVLTVPRDAQRELPAHLREPNLEDWLRARDLARGERPRIGIVQRLDRGTSGVLVFPRTRHARESLKPAFARHDVTRRYLAIALGRPPIAEGTLRDLLVEKHGRMTIRCSEIGPTGPPPSSSRGPPSTRPISGSPIPTRGSAWRSPWRSRRTSGLHGEGCWERPRRRMKPLERGPRTPTQLTLIIR